MKPQKEKLPEKTIRQRVVFPDVSPETVYRAILSSREHTVFTGSPAKCSARVGARFTAWGDYISGKNIELERGRKIVQEWKTSEWPEGYGPSILSISLEKIGTGTQLTMVQEKVPASQYDEYNKGWFESYWEPMKKYFAKKN
ncbi:MAG TPA: SRPBCC domain-containing protein, partial [Candidatus Bathyarchaeia archaeon]|nr:SRPBCC domain-containing protein [Candidatus Bathyarchaeia archaeon]